MEKRGRWRNKLTFWCVCYAVLLMLSLDMPVYADTIIPASEFGDENFYNFIIDNYDTNGNGQLEQSEAEAVTDMYVNPTLVSVNSIKGIELFINLYGLTIGFQYGITDCSYIGELTELNYLSISCVSITDISFLENLTKLKSLQLFSIGQGIDYGIINQFTNLETLAVSDVGITDASFVNGLNRLESLRLDMNHITELPDLSQFPNLKNLNISYNDITDYSEILDVKETLEELNISAYGDGAGSAMTVEQISFLSEMTKLTSLFMTNCQLEDLPDLTALTGLVQGDFGHNYLNADELEDKLPVTITSQANWKETFGLSNQYIRNEPNTEPDVVGPVIDDTSDNENSENDVTDEPDNEENTTPLEPENGGNGNDEENQDAIFNIEDVRADFNIKMEGRFDREVYVLATRIMNTSQYQAAIQKLHNIVDNISVIILYDISVCDKFTNEKVQPIGEVKVSIELDSDEEGEYYVFRLGDDGEWIEMTSYVSDGYIHFYSDHFSIYSVVMTELVEDSKVKIKAENENKFTNEEDENANQKFDPRTEIAIVVIIFLVVFVYDWVRRFVIKR